MIKKQIKKTINNLPYIKKLVVERDLLRRERKQLQQPWVAYEPHLLPPLHLIQQEGVEVLEEWLRWGEEWSMLLRIYGNITQHSSILEINCGIGRTAFPLRYVLSSAGRFEGFDIYQHKVDFLKNTFHKAYSNFHFSWADIFSPYYHPEGNIPANEYEFQYLDETFDIVYAASAFPHLLPEGVANYFYQTARVLKQGGRCVFSFFLLDNYHPGRQRPLGFARPDFNFDHAYQDDKGACAVSNPDHPEAVVAYHLTHIEKLADQVGLKLVQLPIPGLWSGRSSTWISTQDLIILEKI